MSTCNRPGHETPGVIVVQSLEHATSRSRRVVSTCPAASANVSLVDGWIIVPQTTWIPDGWFERGDRA